MTNSLVVRLRDNHCHLCHEAADEIERLTKERDEYKIWWERDSKNLGTALNEASSLRAGNEQFRAQLEQPQYRKWPGEPPHCMSCDCGMTDEQKRMVPEADYLRIHKELMDLKYPQQPQGASRDASGHHCLDCGADLSNHPTSASAHRCLSKYRDG